METKHASCEPPERFCFEIHKHNYIVAETITNRAYRCRPCAVIKRALAW